MHPDLAFVQRYAARSVKRVMRHNTDTFNSPQYQAPEISEISQYHITNLSI
jgi:hypothetical protein